MRRVLHALVLVLPLAALTACAGTQSTPEAECAASEQTLHAAESWYNAPERSGLTASSYAAILERQAAAAPDQDRARSERLRQDLTAASMAVDNLDAGYGAVESCRRAAMRSIRAQLAAGKLTNARAQSLEAAQKGALDQALAGARTAALRAAALTRIYGTETELWASAHPGIRAEVIRANTASQAPAAYKATDRSTIYAAPDVHSGSVAALRKGQRVSGPGTPTRPGWVVLELNDGSLGYVMAGVVRPLAPNPSSLRRFGHQTQVSADPIVAAVLEARRSLPEKTQALQARLDAGGEAAADFATLPSAPDQLGRAPADHINAQALH